MGKFIGELRCVANSVKMMDLNIGIVRELVVEPTLSNARGYRDQVASSEIESLTDVNVFSPVELLTPGTAKLDDPVRVAVKFVWMLSPLNHTNAGTRE